VNKVVVGKPEKKRPLGRPKSRWGDRLRMYLAEIFLGGGDGVYSIGSGYRLVAVCCEYGDEPSDSAPRS
jgi:hypothetical protein